MRYALKTLFLRPHIREPIPGEAPRKGAPPDPPSSL